MYVCLPMAVEGLYINMGIQYSTIQYNLYVCVCMYVRMYVCIYVCMYVCTYVYTYMYVHGVRMKSSTQQKVSQLFQNCKYLPEILTATTGTIFTRDPIAV